MKPYDKPIDYDWRIVDQLTMGVISEEKSVAKQEIKLPAFDQTREYTIEVRAKLEKGE